MESTVTLKEGMSFDVELEGHHFNIDAVEEFGGANTGPTPKGLVLSGLAGCGAMDVISLLRKMRQDVTSFSVVTSGEKAQEHPKTIDNLQVTFVVDGDVKVNKLWKAIALSRDRYCGVAAMLAAHTTLTYHATLNGEDVPEPTE